MLAATMTQLGFLIPFCLISLLFSSSASAAASSTSRMIITTEVSKSPSSTVIEYIEASATSYVYVAAKSTVIVVDGIKSTKSVVIEVSSTQIYQDATAATNYLDLAPSFTESYIASGGSIVEVNVVPTATEVYYASVNTSTAYDIDASSLDVFCWYPISGSYGRWPRILYYATLIFALIAKHHDWLVTGALATALAFSGCAAIHACLLIWRGPGYGESDLQALIAILSSACIITVPLLNWSSTLQHLGQEKEKKPKDRWLLAFQALRIKKAQNSKDQPTRTIILYWGFLVTVGFLCVFVSLWKDDLPIYPVTFSGVNTISCAPGPGKALNLAAGQNPSWDELVPNQEFIADNNCIDPCHGVDPYFGLDSIFRTSDDLQILNKHQVDIYFSTDLTKTELRMQNFTHGYQTYGLIFLTYILLQGIATTFFGRRNPIQIRDKIYLLLIQPNGFKAPKWQKSIAKYVALIAFTGAVLIVVICPPLFVVNLVAAELEIYDLPQSETARHIGSWGPWATTGLVLGAAAVAQFHIPVWEGLEMLIKHWARRIIHKRSRSQKRQGLDEERGTPLGSDETTVKRPNYLQKKSTASYGETKQKTSKSAMNVFEKGWFHRKERFRQARQSVRKYWRNSISFKDDPEGIVRDSDRHGDNCKRAIKSTNNVPGTPVNYLKTPLTGDTLVDRQSSQSLPKSHSVEGPGPDYPISARQFNRGGRYSIMPSEHLVSQAVSIFSSPSIRDDHSTMNFQNSINNTPSLFHEDTDCLLNPYEETPSVRFPPSIGGGTIISGGRHSMSDTPERISHATFPSHPSSTQGYFSDIDVQQITHPHPYPSSDEEEERSSHTHTHIPVSNNPFGLAPLSNHSVEPGSRHRSTVSYLQIERPRTMVFEDEEIILRKDSNGIYRVVER